MREQKQLPNSLRQTWNGWSLDLREAVEFSGFFLLFFVFARALLSFWAQGKGLGPLPVQQILADNEMLLQACALLLAVYAQDRRYGRPFWPRILPLPRSHWPLYLECGLGHFVRGALWACLPVGLSVLLGFARVERGPWDFYALIAMAPAVALQAMLIATWILAAEAVRRSLRQLPWAIVFEAILLYRVFCASELPEERLYFAIFSLALAAGLRLWNAWHDLDLRDARGALAPLMRWGFQSGFVVILVNVFGYPLAGERGVSFWSVFEGPLGEAAPSLARQAPPGSLLFGVFFVLSLNTLLLRFLRRPARARMAEKIDAPWEPGSLVEPAPAR